MALLLTFVLGFATAFAFYLVGGRVALLGPYVLVSLGQWPWIYTLETSLVFIAGVALGMVTGPGRPVRWVATVIGLAWVGEYLVLASRILAGELNPLLAAYFWILATAGPIQPVAAFAGAMLGRWVRAKRS